MFAILVHACLVVFREKAAYRLFPILAIIGTVSMGFAFGQNDLANCASPGLAAWNLFHFEDVARATRVDVDWRLLLLCGVLLLAGMTTRNAQRVTRAAVHAGSMSHNVALWAPQWCIILARMLIRLRGRAPTLAPAPSLSSAGKMMHYDSLRACVILTVSASVIATASSLGLPVSTTYVAFAAVIATGAADRILQRGDAELKLARTIWVIFSWFASAIIAVLAAACVCLVIYHLGTIGTLTCMAINLVLRRLLKRRADAQEQRVEEQARERVFPEQFTEPEG
jgi:phosphate/sulfate permease